MGRWVRRLLFHRNSMAKRLAVRLEGSRGEQGKDLRDDRGRGREQRKRSSNSARLGRDE
jgi:hypothetical protein